MKKKILKRILPYFVPVIVLAIITVLCFNDRMNRCEAQEISLDPNNNENTIQNNEFDENDKNEINEQRKQSNGYDKSECKQGDTGILWNDNEYYKIVFIPKTKKGEKKYYATKYAYHIKTLKGGKICFKCAEKTDNDNIEKATEQFAIPSYLKSKHSFHCYKKKYIRILSKTKYEVWMVEHPETEILPY